MRKRFHVTLAVAIVLLCAVVLVLGLLRVRPGVTKANFDRVEIGMSRADVENFFGGPAPNRKMGYMTTWYEIGDGWSSNNNEIAIIVFDPWQHDRVLAKEWLDLNESILQRVRGLLRF